MKGLREFLGTNGGIVAGTAVGLLLVGVAGYVAWSTLGSSWAGMTSGRVFIDAETGRTFHHTIQIGERQPVRAPSGGMTGYEADPCYWTAEGTIKAEPTWALVRSKFEPTAGPTFCPDCDRLVVPLNPLPQAGSNPPPTQAEYQARRAARPQ